MVIKIDEVIVVHDSRSLHTKEAKVGRRKGNNNPIPSVYLRRA